MDVRRTFPLDPTTEQGALIRIGTFRTIYDPSVGETGPWYINDHCIIRGHDGLWHMFGITHAEPLHPMDEKCLAHATAAKLTQTPWKKHPHALTADYVNWEEIHLWAPCVVRHEGLYYMYVCVGDEDHTRYKIHLLTSADLWTWTRHPGNPVIADGFDARDPFVLRIGDEWVLYYTATSHPEGGNHIVACQTSKDLVHWSHRRTVFLDEEKGTHGGSTESPFVLRRGKWFYLLICNNDRRNGYDSTDLYRSEDPFFWSRESRIAIISAHAPEIIRDTDGQWYVTHCGWGRGGLHLAPLHWGDNVSEASE